MVCRGYQALSGASEAPLALDGTHWALFGQFSMLNWWQLGFKYGGQREKKERKGKGQPLVHVAVIYIIIFLSPYFSASASLQLFIKHILQKC